MNKKILLLSVTFPGQRQIRAQFSLGVLNQYLLQVGKPPDEEGLQEGTTDRGRVQAAEVRRVGEVDRPPREVQSSTVTRIHLEIDIKVSLMQNNLI